MRALVVRCADGAELGACVVNYPSGKQGVLLDPKDHHLARQHPGDYLFGLEKSVKGALAVAKGLFASAEFITDTGEVTLEAPWNASRLKMMAAGKPANVELPKEVDFAVKEIPSIGTSMWMLDDRLPITTVTYGRVRVTAGKTPHVTLRNMPVPEDSPVKLPWQAPAVLNEIAAGQKSAKDLAAPLQRQNTPAEPVEGASLAPEGLHTDSSHGSQDDSSRDDDGADVPGGFEVDVHREEMLAQARTFSS